VAGNVNSEQVLQLARKWFEPIAAGEATRRNLPQEPPQAEERKLTVKRDVPQDSIYKAYHMCARTDSDYYATDLISDVLSRGNSSRLHKSLVKEKKLFSEISAYVMGDYDKGLFMISGKLSEGVTVDQAEAAIAVEVEKIRTELVDEKELEKCKNKVESTLIFSEMDVLNKATNLAVAELLGDANDINKEAEKYQRVTATDIRRVAGEILCPENCSTLYYLRN
jgi:zinc protease